MVKVLQFTRKNKTQEDVLTTPVSSGNNDEKPVVPESSTSEKSEKGTSFEEIIRANQEKKRELARKRLEDNQKVKKSYNLGS